MPGASVFLSARTWEGGGGGSSCYGRNRPSSNPAGNRPAAPVRGGAGGDAAGGGSSDHGAAARAGRVPLGPRADLRLDQAAYARRDLRGLRRDRAAGLAGAEG